MFSIIVIHALSSYSDFNIPLGLTPEFACHACERKGRKEEQYEDIYLEYEHNNAAQCCEQIPDKAVKQAPW